MNKWLEKPNNKQHVPDKFIKGTVDLLSSLNQDVMNVGARLEEVEARIQTEKDAEALKRLYASRDRLLKQNETIANRTEKLSKLYENIKNDNDYSGHYSEVLAEKIKNLNELVKDKPIGAMETFELEKVRDTLDYLINEIAKWNKTLETRFIDGKGNEMSIYDISQKAYKELAQRKVVNDNTFNKYMNKPLSAVRFFKRLGGFTKNSVWAQICEMLDQGQLDKLKYMQGAADIFDHLRRIVNQTWR